MDHNEVAHLVLNCPLRQRVNKGHAALSWLMLEERLVFSPLATICVFTTAYSQE